MMIMILGTHSSRGRRSDIQFLTHLKTRMDRTLQFGRRFRTKMPSREEWESDQGLGHGEIWFPERSKIEKGTGFRKCGRT